MALVEVSEVTKQFRRPGGTVNAVDGVSFTIDSRQTLGLIGESGSGKSTVGRLVLGLLRPDTGTVRVAGRDLTQLSGRELRALRADMQVVFQEPLESLNPRMRVGAIVDEPLIVHTKMGAADRRSRVDEIFEQVGLPRSYVHRFPRDLSGGEQQRIGIARAIITNPSLVVLDEPTSSLDLSVRAAILNLLARLQADRDLAYLFISHDIATVRHFCASTAVMYLGKIVEVGVTEGVLKSPAHPYTRALLSAALSVDPAHRPAHFPLKGDLPDPGQPRYGCPLVGRCPIEIPACSQAPIPLRAMGDAHEVACIRADEEASAPAGLVS